LLKQAGNLRETIEKATQALGQVVAEGTAGGGDVVVKANGCQRVLSVRIDSKLLAAGDSELLEDLIVAATNQALERAKEAATQQFAKLAGGLPIPPGFLGLGPGAGMGRP
jgi:DNA-binding YbaB/EbfC family protein